jgi:hypothetical protein
MKQTAVEITIQNVDQCLNAEDVKSMLGELLEMEKQQIIKSYHDGQLSILHIVEESLTPLGFDSTSDKEDKEDAIDYYNETFKNNG